MSLGTREYLQHILAEAEYLIAASRDLTFEEYHADPTLRRAFTRSLEIMGEAAKQLPAALRAEHPEVEWSLMARMRDRLIHGYFSVDESLIWAAVREKVPELKGRIEAILSG